jgi:hypothetical protein
MSWIDWIAFGRRADERRTALEARIDAVNQSLERTAWRINATEGVADRRTEEIQVLHERRHG